MHRPRTLYAQALGILAALPLAAGCSPGDDDDGMFGGGGAAETSAGDTTGQSPDPEPGDTDGSGSDGDTDSSTGSTGTDGGDGSSGGETKFDLPPVPDAPPEPEATPCTKVDMLFVVDNSGSMAGEQENLVGSFPGFVDEILMTLGTVEDLHIGVVATEVHKQNPVQCQKLGALSTASQIHGDCAPFDSGYNWMDESQTNLEQKFTCVGELGTGGSGDEKPMDALQLALTPALNAPGACNDGFLRDDALLVVVYITDEEDDNQGGTQNSQGDPADWFEGVIKHKNHVETNVVTLGLVGHDEPNECDGLGFISSDESAEPAPRLQEFAKMFTYGFLGDVCADSYQPFFHEAISVIDSACTNFTPPEG